MNSSPKITAAIEGYPKLLAAITEHHGQKADDRCVEDDDRLYAAAGLPPCDRRVGDKFAMANNCLRFIWNRCEGGGWRSYVELEAALHALRGHPDYYYCVIPMGKPDAPVPAYLEGWELNPEYKAAPGDVAWRRRKDESK